MARVGQQVQHHGCAGVRRGAPMRVWRQVRRSVAPMALRGAFLFALAASRWAGRCAVCGSAGAVFSAILSVTALTGRWQLLYLFEAKYNRASGVSSTSAYTLA